jgi:hypothetical protein
MCRSNTFTSLRDASKEFEISNFTTLFGAPIEVDWGHEVSRLMHGCD